MADRTAAGLFHDVFNLVAEHVPESESRNEMAQRFWGLTRDYDFSPYQMYCDDALLTLGLARRGVDPEWPENGEQILYGPVVARVEGTRND